MEEIKHQTQTESKTNSQDLVTRTESKKYPVINVDGKSQGIIEADPNLPAHSKKIFPALALMLSHASGRSSLGDGEMQLLHQALKHYGVTTDEAMEAFWSAYADPYVSQGRIEFRHLWKHINEKRGDIKGAMTYEQMLHDMDRRGLPQNAYEIMSGARGPCEMDDQGRFMWRLRR